MLRGAGTTSLVVFLVLAWLPSCASPTQAFVEVDTTLAATDGMTAVRLSTPTDPTPHELPVALDDFPVSFAVVPTGGDLTRVAEVHVAALYADGGIIVERVTEVAFTDGNVTSSQLCLDRRCIGVRCPGGETCRPAPSGGTPSCMPLDRNTSSGCPGR